QRALARPPRPPLLPYTTLFRSPGTSATWRPGACGAEAGELALVQRVVDQDHALRGEQHRRSEREPCDAQPVQGIEGLPGHRDVKSEEHTSELQSRENLVCRLLL